MKIVGVIQQKGGAGKTTIAVNIAHQIKEFFPKLKVAVLDTDVQQSSMVWINRGKNRKKSSIEAISMVLEGQQRNLRPRLKEISVDVAIIDSPPSVEDVALKVALASDLILVPICASALDLDAARAAIDVCNEAIVHDRKKNFRLIPNKVQTNTSAGKELRAALNKFGPVTKASIGLRIGLADSVAAGEGINTYDPNSIAHQEIKALTKEVCDLLGLKKGA